MEKLNRHDLKNVQSRQLFSSYGGKSNWKVIKVIGKPFMKKEYELVDDILFIKCEDSYLHLLKKLALSLKYIYKLFNKSLYNL